MRQQLLEGGEGGRRAGRIYTGHPADLRRVPTGGMLKAVPDFVPSVKFPDFRNISFSSLFFFLLVCFSRNQIICGLIRWSV